MATYKTVFFVLGILLVVLGVFMTLPMVVQLVYDQKDSGFVSSSCITILIGILLILANWEKNPKINLQQAFLLTSVSWIGIAAFGSLPFIFSNLNLSISEAFFESMSGITTTGSTVISDLNNAPKGILIWRAILQWLGGIGIIVMAITVLPLLNVGGMQLFRRESSSTEKILPKTREVASIIFGIYLFLTFLCTFSYWIFGMTIFDSIAHAMTTIATGGFSTYNESIGFFQNPNSTFIYNVVFLKKHQLKDLSRYLGIIMFLNMVYQELSNSRIDGQKCLIQKLIILLEN